MPSFSSGSTVTIVRRVLGEPDDYGNDTYVNISEDVRPCSIQPGASAEVTQGTEQVTSDVVVYMPAGTRVSELDALFIGGVKYEIQGKPGEYHSPFTGANGPVEVRANRVTGVSV